ncbi:Hypothetical protein A7982_05569 [Minicystis rosea]|nr:Hypothetical protein A7982_05569 [Minicystis rosea]
MIAFQRTGRRERLFLEASHHLDGTPVAVPDRSTALLLLRDLSRDPWGMAALRRVYVEVVGRSAICSEGDRAVLEALAHRLVTGQLRVRSVELPDLEVPEGSLLPVSDGGAPVEPKPPAPTFVEVLVLFADTGQPVPSIKLKIKPPGGSPAEHTTDSSGLIRVEGLKKDGDCEISSDIKGVKRAESLVVSGAPPSAPSGDKPKGKQPDYKLITLTRYKVKTGDSLDSLAKKVGITGKDLAKFNWGTDDPKEINKHLRWDVGCTKKSGSNYVFDDSDKPGLIYLPEPLDATAPTGGRTVLGVETLIKARPWIFSL